MYPTPHIVSCFNLASRRTTACVTCSFPPHVDLSCTDIQHLHEKKRFPNTTYPLGTKYMVTEFSSKRGTSLVYIPPTVQTRNSILQLVYLGINF